MYFPTGPTEILSLDAKVGLFSVVLTWKEPILLYGILRHYTVQYTVNGTIQRLQTVNYNSFFISNLYPSTVVSDISVSAVTGGGTGPSVTIPNITTLDEPGEHN